METENPWRDPEELKRVRDILAQDGVKCPLEECDVIIQADENGQLGHGIQLHCNTVH